MKTPPAPSQKGHEKYHCHLTSPRLHRREFNYVMITIEIVSTKAVASHLSIRLSILAHHEEATSLTRPDIRSEVAASHLSNNMTLQIEP